MQKGIATWETFLIDDTKYSVNSVKKVNFKILDQ